MQLNIPNTLPGGLVVRSYPDCVSLSVWCGNQEIALTIDNSQRDRIAAALTTPGHEIISLSGHAFTIRGI
ncbi:MAG: hypothetical protein PHG21_03765 [Azoarcus sp.]|nr:hypothetical protein [Azoarcus sp.]